MIEEGQIADVLGQRAAWPFFVEDDGHGAALDALAKTDTATARQPRVRESFQHPAVIILQELLDLLLDPVFCHRPEMALADRAIATDEKCNRHADNRAVRIIERILPE